MYKLDIKKEIEKILHVLNYQFSETVGSLQWLDLFLRYRKSLTFAIHFPHFSLKINS